MDPVTAFAFAQAAIAGVRKCVDLYKEAKALSADVSSIATEVSGHIGQFLEAKEHLEQGVVESKKRLPKKGESLNKVAFDNIMRIRQLAADEKEIREYLIYSTPWGGIWSEFEAERKRLHKEMEEAQREAKKPRSWLFGKDRCSSTNTKPEWPYCWPFSFGSLSWSL